MQSAEEITTCPDCGHRIRVDRRYVTWCDQCDWNVDPTPRTDQTPAWRLRLEHRLAESLYRELEKGAVHRPGWDAARIAAHLLSALILLLPLIGLLAGIAVLAFYRPLWVGIPVSLPAFGIAFLFRPRAARLPADVHLLGRDQAPALFGRMLNASVGVLARGLAWLLNRLSLGGRQRAEYLADRKAGEIAGSRPSRTNRWSTTARYRAPHREATAQALERVLLAGASHRAMVRALRFPTEIEPLEAVRRAVTEVPAREIERHLRASRVRETRTDATHPPTYLRTRLVRARPATAARVTLGIDQSRTIDRELEPAARTVLFRLL